MINKTIGSIGSGADYQSIYDAMVYAGAGQGDDIDFNIIDSGATVGGGLYCPFTTGTTVTIHCSNNEASNDISSWYTVSTNNAVGDNYWRLNQDNLTLIIKNVAFIVDGGAAGPGNICGVWGNDPAQNYTIVFEKCVFAGNAASASHENGLYVGKSTLTNVTISGCKFYGFKTAIYSFGDGPFLIENCSVGENSVDGISSEPSTVGTIRNCVVIGSTSADYHANTVASFTFTNSASEDSSLNGVGTNCLYGITPANEFVSATPPADVGAVAQINNDYLNLIKGSIYNGGTTPTYSSSDIIGYAIPYSGNYQIGCHVLLVSRKNRIMGPF